MSPHTRRVAILATCLAAAALTAITLAVMPDRPAPTRLELLLGITILNSGVAVAAFGLYRQRQLDLIGLEHYDKASRKQIEKAATKGALPDDTALHAGARRYARTQLGLVRHYIAPFVLITIGIAALFTAVNVLLRTNETGVWRYLNPVNIFYVFNPLILLSVKMHRIRQNARQLNVPLADTEPPKGDDRWWTGIW